MQEKPSRGCDVRALLTDPAVAVEVHGRAEQLMAEADLAHSVGCFTAIYLLRLEVDPGRGPAWRRPAGQGSAVRLPDDGVGHRLLRYLNDAAPLGARLGFNYLGRLGAGIGAWSTPPTPSAPMPRTGATGHG